MQPKLKFIALTATLLSLAGCSTAKEQLGLSHRAPDEFAVVKRAPLAMPPNYDLRPPQPGAARPQEISPQDIARDATLGAPAQSSGAASNAENFLLQQTGGVNADSSIRTVVNAEAAKEAPKDQPVAKKLLNIGKDQEPASTIVDPAKEAQRLKSNRETGKSVTDGETPVIEQ